MSIFFLDHLQNVSPIFEKTGETVKWPIAIGRYVLPSHISLPHAMNPIYNRLSVWGPGGLQPTSIEVTI